jgi:signal transduction histidine kinase
VITLGLRAKFILYSNTVIAVTMCVATYLAALHDRRSHYEAARDHLRSVAGAISIAVTDALMYEDLGFVTESGLTDNFIQEVVQQHREHLRYIIVSDRNGRVTHSNRWNLLGTTFERALAPAAAETGPVETRREEAGEHLLELTAPLNISTRFWGSVSLGYSLAPIEQELADFTWRLIQVALLLMLANSVLTMLYVESLIRPILHLHQQMKSAGTGNLGARVHTRPGDEVGDLGTAFNRMMDELETARDVDTARQTQLAHTEKMAALGTLAAGVAHEVNNPLGGILACIENMRADPHDRDMRERYLGLIHDGLRRIERTIANLLDFSRRRDMHPEAASLNGCLMHVAELVDYQFRRGRIEVKLELDQADPIIMGDHFQIEQLFLNLVLNAVQAMPDGGTLTIRTRLRDGSVVAEVRDTGVGIPEAIRDRIFDPFFSTRPVGEGTGLGLAVSDSIVASHQGRIEVESRPGAGSVFRVVLPAAGAAAKGA